MKSDYHSIVLVNMSKMWTELGGSISLPEIICDPSIVDLYRIVSGKSRKKIYKKPIS